jgi:predicted dithiol-disulfide oxidoreductase (DUF899 family)
MSEHKVGTRKEWLAARKGLLERKKELTRRSDALARERQELPWVPVDKEYTFESNEGTKTLAELFDGRSQLLVYHFMFGPSVEGWPEAGCPGCSYTADSLDGAVAHLPHRDVTFVAVSRAPLERLNAYKRRMGWSFPWVSFGEGSSISTSPCSPRRGAEPARASTSERRSTRTSTSARRSCTV